MTKAVQTIRGAFKRCHINTDKAISRETGIKYETLHKNRLTEGNIGRLTLSELWCMQRHGLFTDEELLRIAKGGEL